jgi:tetratricopeptide (TPR) repeat protein
MAKQKKSHIPISSLSFHSQLIRAQELMNSGETEQAIFLLESLNVSNPKNIDVLGLLADGYMDLGDIVLYEDVMRTLAQLQPNDVDIQNNLIMAYTMNQHMGLAYQAMERFEIRWPGHPLVSRINSIIHQLKAEIVEQAAIFEIPEESAVAAQALFDELRISMLLADYERTRVQAEELLKKFPKFVPAQNNLVEIYAMEGRFLQAIQISNQVLETIPDNIHALANLVRLCFLSGKPAEALGYANRLKHSKAPATDRWMKIAQALSFIEDDQGVLDLYQQAKAAKQADPEELGPDFFHFLAVAAAHLDMEKLAIKYWKEALKLDPYHDPAIENLEDIRLPKENRQGPWAFTLGDWLIAPLVNDLVNHLPKSGKSSSLNKEYIFKLVDEKYPEILFLASHLIERGDVTARELIVHLACTSNHPRLVEVALAFVHGKRGTFEERFSAANMLVQENLLPPGPIHLWHDGEFKNLLLFNTEIVNDSAIRHMPRKVRNLFEKAVLFLQDGNGVEAQSVLEQALIVEPDNPSLLNNLAGAHMLQGHDEIFDQMMKDLCTRFPDYFFGKIYMANLARESGNFEEARKILSGLFEKEKMLISEFVGLCKAQVELGLAEHDKDYARNWLQTWEQINPDNPEIAEYRLLIRSKKK